MATKRYDEEPVLGSPIVGTDISCLSRAPFGNGAAFNKFTMDELVTWVDQEIGTSASNVIYLDPVGGDDSTADGTILKQFKTMAAANAAITTGSVSNPFVIAVGAGVLTEASFEKKPFVSYVGWGEGASVLTAAGGWTLSADYDGTAAHTSNISNFELRGCNINFTTASFTTTSLILNVDTIRSGDSTLSIKCPSDGGNMAISNCTVTTGITFDNGTFILRQISSNNLTILSSVGGPASVCDSFGGSFSLVTLTSNVNLFVALLGSSTVNVTLTETAGTLILFVDSVSYPTGTIIENGSPTITRLTHGDAIDADTTPSNYTPVDPTVKGNFEGIDTALGVGGKQRYFQIYGNELITAGVTTSIVNSQSAVRNFGPTGTDDGYYSYNMPLEATTDATTLEFYWSPSSNAAGGVVWQMEVSITIPNNNETIGTTILSSQQQTVTVITTTQDELLTSTFTIPSIDNATNPDIMVELALRRLGADGADTFSGQAQVSKLNIIYTIG